jgi:hypothetical protein
VGEWRRADISYLKVHGTFCNLCGQPLPGRFWAVELKGQEQVFCSPEHEEKFISYWLRRYGHTAV